MRRFIFNLRRLRLLLICAGTLFPLFLPHAFAQQISMRIDPARFEFVASPGATIHATVQFTNGADTPLPIFPESADVRSQGEEGKMEVGVADDPAHSLKEWLVPLQTELSIPAKTTVPIDFEIRVPAGATSGAYWGALVLRTQGRYNLAPIILINVRGGATENVVVASFDGVASATGSLTFVARLRNEGALFEKPQGTISVRNIVGMTVAEVPLPAENIFPGYVRKVEAHAVAKLFGGPYTARLRATYGNGGEVMATARFWVMPRRSGLAGVGLLLVMIVAGVMVVRARRNFVAGVP
jgi:hypothetical protein